MNAKSTYTIKELTKRSTAQLISIYNRVFNTNIWEDYFNPFEHRQEMILALYAETQAAEALEALNARETAGDPLPRYSGMKIEYTQEGVAIIWMSKFTNPVAADTRKYTTDVVKLVHEMRAAGISMRKIGQELDMKTSRVFRILKGWVYADVAAAVNA